MQLLTAHGNEQIRGYSQSTACAITVTLAIHFVYVVD